MPFDLATAKPDTPAKGGFDLSTAKPDVEDPSLASRLGQGVANFAAGAVRGAGSIGATLLTPIDAAARAVGVQNDYIGRTDRRQAMDEGLKSMGADTESLAFQGGKLGAEIAGTAGAGGAIAAPLRMVAPRLAQALATGGASTGAAVANRAADLGIRATGGLVSGGASAGLVNPEDAAQGAAIGAAFPVATKLLGAGAKAAGRAIAGKISPDVVALFNRAKQLGIDIPADRITDSKSLNAVAAGLNYVPFSGRAATESRMQSQLNRALSRTFGQDSDNVTMALRKAQTDLGGKFDDVLTSNTVKLDQQFLDDLAAAEGRADSELGRAGAKIIKNQIDEIVTKAATNGEIDGQAAYNIKKTLDRIGRRNTPEAFYADDLKRDLMAALNRSMPADEAEAFAQVRRQYGSMLELRKLAQNGLDGDVSISRIANMKNINNPEMQELADIAAQFLKPREGQHGAAQRAFAGLAGTALGGPGAAAAGIATGRVLNTALDSSALKNLMTGQAQDGRIMQLLQKPGVLETLYRGAPVVGTSLDEEGR